MHSPFVYRLVKEVLDDRKSYYIFDALEAERRRLLHSNEVIEVTDLGAGSQRNTGKHRKVSEIARHSLKYPRYARLLFRLIQHLNYKRVLELGTSLGITTAYLTAAAEEVVSLEGCTEQSRVAADVANGLGLAGRMRLLTGAFDDLLLHPEVVGVHDAPRCFDLIFIDGHHRGDALLRYVNKLQAHLNPGGCMVIDDINWSADMRQAWNKLIQREDFTLSIDLFEMGLLFTELDMVRQHFVLRY